MEKKIIQEIILQQQSFIQKINLQKRDVKIDPAGNYVFVGIRRAGKTYMLYQHIQQLTNEGHDIREMLFVNFEDERISDMRKEDLHTVIDAYRELFDFEPIIFLDEIQNIDGWEHFARRLADEGRRLYVFFVKNEFLGQVRFDSDGWRDAVISISLASAFRGWGLASVVLQKAVAAIHHEHAALQHINAYVKPANVASRLAFEKAGFRPVECERADSLKFIYSYA